MPKVKQPLLSARSMGQRFIKDLPLYSVPGSKLDTSGEYIELSGHR